MSIIPDTSGFQREDDDVWVDPATGDVMSSHFFDLVPNLPAGLDDLPRLRHELAVQTAADGGLVEAFVVTVDGQPALLQIVKLPLPDRPGLGFIASITVPKDTCSAVLKLTAVEGPTTGIRESMVLADTISETGSPDAFASPHPYAPETSPKLPWNRADDPRYDERIPDHPLSRCRRWLRHVLATARLAPEFAAKPAFGSPVSVSIGLPIGPFLPLWVNQEMTFWQMQDPDAVRALLGRSKTDRRPISGTDEAWEAAWLHPAAGTLALAGNLPPVRVAPVSDETAYTSITAEDLTGLFDWIGEVSVAAGDRDEILILTPKAEADGHNFVLMCRLPADGDRAKPYCVVEASPVPVGAEFWDTLPPPSNPKKAGYAYFADDAQHQARTDGRMTLWAVETWDVHPFRLILAYRPNQAMRVTAEASAPLPAP
ncbi:hypothetical protein [Labedaea rhizosphaerae]|uniref:Uncharacterized protein n=1 Tax=Labedaea rhizosphaerae TaxID=598644 RepID=A0A4R6S540_LABRH|nr:hypothetical protein [Labedaea rhizosphaerae]TDP94852.1 hypothetical protein EV186_10584 [Labedaea rhizosphaerae]